MTVPDDPDDNVIEREHPASDEEFAAVAVLTTLAFETDTMGSALPPLWPMLLHFFSDFAPPTGTAAGTLDASAIPQLIRALLSPLVRHQHGGAFGMKNVLSRENSPIDDAIAAGAVPLLAKLLENDDTPATQFEAAWALMNIASRTTDHTACMVNTPGLIASFVRLLGSADQNICDQAVWALSNIAADSPIYRDHFLERGVLTELTHIPERLSDGGMSVTLHRSMTWTISNLCRGEPAPPLSAVASALPYLTTMIQYPDNQVVADALWSLSYISYGTSDRISAVLAHGTLPTIMRHLLGGAGQAIESPALRCLGNILTGDDHQTALAIEHGAITVLCAMLRAQVPNPRSETQKEILWTLSSIAGGNEQQINALLQAGVFAIISDYIAMDDQNIRKEGQRTVANALQYASPADVPAIIGSASFRALLDAASSHRICPAGVEGITTALEREFDAVAAIASLDELSAIVASLYEDKDPDVQQHMTVASTR
jgi:importin subunit alpha-1